MQFTAVASDSRTGLTGSLGKTITINTAQAPVAPLIGARGGPSNALSNFTNATATIGPLNCTKLFNSAALPATFVGQTEDELPAGVVPVVCYKQVNTNVASYVNSVTRPLWLVYHQEPEGDYTLGSQFVSEFVSQSDLIRAQGNPFVKVVCCSGGYPYRNAGTDDVLAGNYIPPASAADYFCKDVYQDQASRYPSLGLQNYDEWVNWLAFVAGRKIGVTEYGIGLTGTTADRNARIKQDCAYLRTLGISMWQYWWVNMGTAATNYQFTDATTIATWRAIEAGTI